jgi:hypothetical protein
MYHRHKLLDLISKRRLCHSQTLKTINELKLLQACNMQQKNTSKYRVKDKEPCSLKIGTQNEAQ